MSAQINLYHPRYLKQREWLALGPVLVAALGFYLLLAAVAGWASHDADRRQGLAAATEAQLKVAKAEVAAATQALAVRKPNAQLQAEVQTVETLLQRREAILRLLEGGAIGTTAGFAEHFRALARQVPEGLWLTGFSVGAGGDDIRISGSTLHAAAVPDYIGRLGREAAFRGKSFSALTMQRPTAADAQPGAAAGGGSGTAAGALISALAGAAPAPTVASGKSPAAATSSAPVAIDFVLMPKPAASAEAKP